MPIALDVPHRPGLQQNARQPRSAGCLIAAERELVIRRRGEPIARVLPMMPQRRLPSHADLRQRMPLLQTPSAELIRNERDER